MTAVQAAERQALLASMHTSILRPETVERIQDVLKRMESMHCLGPREIGRLQWDAFAALTDLQVDLRLKFQNTELQS